MACISPEQATAAAASVAALAAVVGTLLASRNARKTIEIQEMPFLIPDPGLSNQWRLKFEDGRAAPALRAPLHNVGKGPAIMGDVQLIIGGAQILSPAGGQIPFRPNEDQSLPLQLLDRHQPEVGQEGELRVYYTHASGARYMTRCHVKVDEAGVLPTSFRRERSDGAERPFLFQSTPAS
jgi:hypothetical protein